MDAWLNTVIQLGPITTTARTAVAVGLAVIAAGSLVSTVMVWAACLRRRQAAKAAGLPAYAGGALGG